MDFSVGRGPGAAGVADQLCVVSQLTLPPGCQCLLRLALSAEQQALGLVGGAVLSAAAVAQQVLGCHPGGHHDPA